MKGHYSRFSKFLTRHRFALAIFGCVFLFVIASGGLVAANGQTVRPEDSHIVVIHDESATRIIPTRSATVADVLQKQNLSVGQYDVVEPELKTPIDADNFAISIRRAEPLTILDNGKVTSLLSPYDNPREAIEKAGIKLYDADQVTQTYASDFLNSHVLGRQLVIERANMYRVSVYGNIVEQHSRATNVSELLKEMKINLATGDTVVPGVDSTLTNGQIVQVNHFGKQVITQEVEINYETETRLDANVNLGGSSVIQEGVKGKKLVTYELTVVNGVETSRQSIQEVVVTQPIKKIVAIGKKVLVESDRLAIVLAAGIPESDYPYIDYIVSHESGWCPTKWQGQYGQCPGYYMDIHSPSDGLGYGLCQSTPAIKMASAGADWQTNPVTQLKWCSNYANSGKFAAYGGGWYGAYNYWLSHNNW